MTVVTSEDLRGSYLDLMRKCLAFSLWDDDWRLVDPAQRRPRLRQLVVRAAVGLAARAGVRLIREEPFDEWVRGQGLDHPRLAHTMIGLRRLENLQHCVEDVIRREVPGDLIETGVWRGGATIFMRAILKSYGVTDRLVWVADSFAGLPEPDAVAYPADATDRHHAFDSLRVSLEEVRANFQRYDLLDDQVRFLKGWFKDTLKDPRIERLSVLRVDGDMYESTAVALASLYPKLSAGGYVIIDDYSLPACRQAVRDFRAAHGIREEIRDVDWTAVFWQRERE